MKHARRHGSRFPLIVNNRPRKIDKQRKIDVLTRLQDLPESVSHGFAARYVICERVLPPCLVFKVSDPTH